MDRRAELKRAAKALKPEAAVYQIRNVRNGMILVESTLNTRTLNGRRIELARGAHSNARLRADLQAFGADAFVFEVLEVLDDPDDGFVYRRDALKRLEAAWLDRLQPYDARGYNTRAARV
jgi:hypothetical protein